MFETDRKMLRMRLDEEIVIYQFAQGVSSAVDLPDRFTLLDERAKCSLFLGLDSLAEKLKPIDADIDRALIDSGLTEADLDEAVLNSFRGEPDKSRFIAMPSGRYEPANRFLLFLIKTAYQRQFSTGQKNPENWRYRDLSTPEFVQTLLANHRALVDEVYAHPSYRGEFVSLARLWYAHLVLEQTQYKEPVPEPQTNFDFVTYDELVVASMEQVGGRHLLDIWYLREALEKAFSKRYQVDTEQASRLVSDVTERHLQNTYRINLDGEESTPGT